jgi:hydroxymethylpyrimidine/phosphomethylpyrimidine kinase
MPLALLVTPNLPEAAVLTGAAPARNEDEMTAQARALLTYGAANVLIKGGHAAGAESVDLLIGNEPGMTVRLAAPRVATQSTHGSGCTLSSAVAAGLAKGLDLVEAVRAAKAYVTAAIAKADTVKVGKGHGPLHHFHAFW